ncbi:MAG TPA: DUF4382 domain-containing protein [Steroidobacteraceae bacterium]|nr:DUF4382 domain-containing protein [Steroidobacteraceae bacterium]
MQRNMLRRAVYCALVGGLTAGLAACGGGGDSAAGTTPPPAGMGTMPVLISDASADDWGVIGVRVLAIALVPQGGGDDVTVWTAPTPAPLINLEQLDQLGELLGNASVPTGTYSGALLTVSANPGDVRLTVADNPESGFPLAAGTTVPSDQIQIQGKSGAPGKLTVAVHVRFDSPLTVTCGTNNALELEFDLNHPAFIVGHTPAAAAGATLWAVDFEGPLRHRPVHDIAALVLRHLYGSVGSVAADAASLTVTRDFPVLPVTNPETAVAGVQSLQIEADAGNGTIIYDVDAKTRSIVTNFSAQAMTLPGKFVRIAARYQEDGSLVAVRIWASSEFSKVWLSPEGHVAHVNTAADLITVDDESGVGVPVSIDANTQFFFRAPAAPSADATPIGTGTRFLASGQLVRGFKVHVSAVDPLAIPMVAQSVDIETAAYAGRISAAGSGDFTYTRSFARATDDYTVSLDYIAATTPNGTDGSGNPVTGFKWWDLTFPTLVTTGSAAIPDFVSATAGGVNFGGTVGALQAWGVSRATWGDPADPSGWALRNAVLVPTPVPLGTVTTPFAGGTFAMSVVGGTLPATVAVSTSAQSATLVYQVDRSGGVLTVSPIDVTTAQGLQALSSGLSAGALVKVYGVPQPDATLRAYVLVYYTGMMPAS